MIAEWLQGKALAIIISAIPLGVIVSIAFQWVKKQSDWVDGLSPLLKNGAIFAIAAALTTLGTILGVPIVCEEGINCLTALDENTIRLLLEATIALGAAKFTHVVIRKKG